MKEKTNFEDYFIEMMNNEILKMRKEIYEKYHEELCKLYEIKIIQKAFSYFYALPVMNTLNRSSFDLLKEACQSASFHDEIQKNQRVNKCKAECSKDLK